MQLISDITRDGRHHKPDRGSYEWWYFDGISEEGDYQIVIIFYDGYPFSPRYIRSLDAGTVDDDSADGGAGSDGDGAGVRADGGAGSDGDTGNAMPGNHPAISISVYHQGNSIFYSLSQYPAKLCSFEDGVPAVTIGNNSFRFTERMEHGVNEYGSFDLRINELLPSGDELKGIITIIGMNPFEKLFPGGKAGWNETDADGKGEAEVPSGNGHLWNMAMPRGRMQCRINLIKNELIRKELKFDGIGYHDHNLGREPMKNRFRDWYWGRAHFPQATLIYYVINRTDGEQDVQAWLVSPDNRRLLHTLELVKMKRRRTNGFLMSPARCLLFRDDDIEVSVLHQKVIDSGPFYYRYISSATLIQPSLGSELVQGVGEYIRPQRVHSRIFWPLINMRMRYIDR